MATTETKKYIKKIKLGTDDALHVKDTEAVSSINGYTVNENGKVVDTAGNEILFANEPITNETIDGLLEN
jgi:hypothetical protein